MIPGGINTLLMRPAADDAEEAYSVDNSCRFDGSTSSLNRTFGTPTDNDKWTWACWVKRSKLGTLQLLFSEANISGSAGSGVGAGAYFAADDTLNLYDADASGSGSYLQTTRVFRDTSAWYHLTWSIDGTVGIRSAKVYVNGVEETSFVSASYPVARSLSKINTADVHYIGDEPDYATHFSGYLADMHFWDGQIKTPAAVTETNSDGQLVPIAYTGTDYGNNGFHLTFDSTAAATVFTDSSTTGTTHTITANDDVTHARETSTFTPKIGDSSIHFDGDGDYLSVPDSDDWHPDGDYTVEGWFNFSTLSSHGALVSKHNTGNAIDWQIFWLNTGYLYWYSLDGEAEGTFAPSWTPTLNAWHHVAVVISNSGDLTTIYIDGTSIGSNDSSSAVYSNRSGNLLIGRGDQTPPYQDFTGYADEIRISDKARYDADFSENLPTTAFTDDDNTLLLVQSNWGGGLGGDDSGNENDFADTGIAASDQMIDTPSSGKNFATLNPLAASSGATLTEGNLALSTGSGVGLYGMCYSTIAMGESGDTQKYYAEFCVTDDDTAMIGMASLAAGTLNHVGNNSESWGYYTNGSIYWGNATIISGNATYADGDVIGVLYDASANTITFYKNGTAQSQGFSSTHNLDTKRPLLFAVSDGSGAGTSGAVVNFGQDHTFALNKTALSSPYADSQGIGEFWGDGTTGWTLPSGARALCTANLPTPGVNNAVAPAFAVKVYADGAGAKTFDGTADMKPDLVWVKSRGSTSDHKLTDSMRGVEKALESNTEDDEATESTGLKVFGADGFTVGSDTAYADTNGDGMVAWAWKAGTEEVAQSGAYTYELGLELTDDGGNGWGGGTYSTPYLEVYEGTVHLGDAMHTFETFGTKYYTIKTNNKDAIKIVWVYDSFDGGALDEQGATLKNGAVTLGTVWTTARTVEDGTVWIDQSTASNESTTGTLATGTPTTYPSSNANADAGFSIAKWTGDCADESAAQTVNHRLGVVPEMIIAKGRTDTSGMGSNWWVYHKDLTSSRFLKLNSSSLEINMDVDFMTSINTTSVDFSNNTFDSHYLNYGGDGFSNDPDTYIAYLFASVEGYSKVGSYEGTGSGTDLPFVYTGFRPAFVMLKNADNGGVHWNIHDATRSPSNVAEDRLSPNESNAEDTGWDEMEFFSNGFRPAVGDSGNNGSDETIIYYAVAENPFKYTTAR